MKFLFTKNPVLLEVVDPTWVVFTNSLGEIVPYDYQAPNKYLLPSTYLNTELTYTIVPSSVEPLDRLSNPEVLISKLAAFITNTAADRLSEAALSAAIDNSMTIVIDGTDYQTIEAKLLISDVQNVGPSYVSHGSEEIQINYWFPVYANFVHSLFSVLFYDGIVLHTPELNNGVYTTTGLKGKSVICISPNV